MASWLYFTAASSPATSNNDKNVIIQSSEFKYVLSDPNAMCYLHFCTLVGSGLLDQLAINFITQFLIIVACLHRRKHKNKLVRSFLQTGWEVDEDTATKDHALLFGIRLKRWVCHSTQRDF